MSNANTNDSSATNWAQIDAQTDETIDTSDIPPLTEADFGRATVRRPRRRVTITVQVDPEVLAWYQAQGGEYEQRLRAALRIYADAHKAI